MGTDQKVWSQEEILGNFSDAESDLRILQHSLAQKGEMARADHIGMVLQMAQEDYNRRSPQYVDAY